MTMDTCSTDSPDQERDDLISFLTYNEEICFKSQQRWEPDLTHKEKFKIGLDVYENNKLTFLLKFGKYLKRDQLGHFKKFTAQEEPDSEEIFVVLADLYKNCSSSSNATTIRNRRYNALKQMIQEDSYFSEVEMMKRNPLLYDQLVGQYLTDEEVRGRDKYEINEQVTFVNILMEGIEREDAEKHRKLQEEAEDCQMEEEDESSDEEDVRAQSPIPSTSRWGEFESDKKYRPKPKNTPAITAEERLLLKDEFVTTMYQSFLDGKDVDFNYTDIDGDTSFDNVDEINKDAEEKYFESEEPEDADEAAESSEDELDIYMNALTQHPAVSRLANDLNKM